MNGLIGPQLSITPLDLDETFTGISAALFHAVDEGSILGDDEVWSIPA